MGRVIDKSPQATAQVRGLARRNGQVPVRYGAIRYSQTAHVDSPVNEGPINAQPCTTRLPRRQPPLSPNNTIMLLSVRATS